MTKVFALLFIIILSLAALTGYLFLTEKITSGQQRIVAGQIELANGEKMLAAGKAKLSHSKRMLSGVNGVSGLINDIPFMGMAKRIPVGGTVLKAATSLANEGNTLIANGQTKIENGEKELAEGKLEMSRGEQRLSTANKIRLGCAFASGFFALLAIALGIYWRQRRHH